MGGGACHTVTPTGRQPIQRVTPKRGQAVTIDDENAGRWLILKLFAAVRHCDSKDSRRPFKRKSTPSERRTQQHSNGVDGLRLAVLLADEPIE